MWRRAYNIEWTVCHGFLCVKGSWEGTAFIFPPYGDIRSGVAAVTRELLEYFRQSGNPFLIKSASQAFVEQLAQDMSGIFSFQEDRDNYDYIYLASDLAGLKGRKYSKKRNHVYVFKKNYPQYCYLPLSESLIPRCIDSALDWHMRHAAARSPILEYEKDAIIEVLNNFSLLGLHGGAVLLDDKVEAFTFGEMLNDDTAVIHTEKGNPELNGIYQVINQEFCAGQWSHLTYINREEDMGIPGLRTAKESYYPVKMIQKFDVTLK